MLHTSLRTWTDENTGRDVHQLTNESKGANLGYFRLHRHLPDGRMLAYATSHGEHGIRVLDADSGDMQPLELPVRQVLNLRTDDGLLWYTDRDRVVWAAPVLGGQPTEIGRIPDDLPGHIVTITFDGRYILSCENFDDQTDHPAPHKLDAKMFWHYVSRPRKGRIWIYDLQQNEARILVETEGHCPFHIDTCPSDPGLIRYALDRFEGKEQRVYLIRADGSDHKPMRPQQPGELVTHEFWWSDGEHVGYTFQDRRNDDKLDELPWCEYSPTATQLGIADRDGNEIYLSDPVNHYHTHLYCSFNGKLISGSGTDGHSFVHAAAFSWDSPTIDFQKLATIHTPYVPFRGQRVNCDFSADGKWLIYADEIDGVHQLCKVAVDL